MGQKKSSGNIRDGEMDGPWEEWYENGWKERVQNCDFGKLVSATVWKPDGEKCPVSNVVNGKGELIDYNEDGTINKRHTFKDCLLYTSPSPRDATLSRMPSSA